MKFCALLMFLMGYSYISQGQALTASEPPLKEKGVFFEAPSLLVSEYQYSLLSNLEFDLYRKYNKRSKIQIEHGPLLNLFSFNELKSMGVSFNTNLAEQKINAESAASIRHEVITLVDIGWNFSPTEHSETSGK